MYQIYVFNLLLYKKKKNDFWPYTYWYILSYKFQAYAELKRMTIYQNRLRQLTWHHLSVKLYIDQSNMVKIRQMHVANCEYSLQ